MANFSFHPQNVIEQVLLIKKNCKIYPSLFDEKIDKIITKTSRYGIWPLAEYIYFMYRQKQIKAVVKKLLYLNISKKKGEEKWLNQFARDMGGGMTHSYKFNYEQIEEIGCATILQSLEEIKKIIPFINMEIKNNKEFNSIHVLATYKK